MRRRASSAAGVVVDLGRCGAWHSSERRPDRRFVGAVGRTVFAVLGAVRCERALGHAGEHVVYWPGTAEVFLSWRRSNRCSCGMAIEALDQARGWVECRGCRIKASVS